MSKKAVLIFDMPEACWQCPCVNTDDYDFYCMVNSNSLHNRNKRPDWCPLIEVSADYIRRAEMYLDRVKYAKEDRL